VLHNQYILLLQDNIVFHLTTFW